MHSLAMQSGCGGGRVDERVDGSGQGRWNWAAGVEERQKGGITDGLANWGWESWRELRHQWLLVTARRSGCNGLTACLRYLGTLFMSLQHRI